jgi:hypothetical protein
MMQAVAAAAVDVFTNYPFPPLPDGRTKLALELVALVALLQIPIPEVPEFSHRSMLIIPMDDTPNFTLQVAAAAVLALVEPEASVPSQ